MKNDLIRLGLTEILKKNNINICDIFNNGKSLIQNHKLLNWNCLILDLELKDRDSFELIKAIKTDHPKKPILAISTQTHEQYAIRAFRVGADGYITKDCSIEEFLHALTFIKTTNEKYIHPSMATRIISDLSQDNNKNIVNCLSDREFQVLTMISSGLTTKDIASKLFISSKTVSTYRSRILEKLNLENTAQLIRFGLDHQLAD